MAARHIPAERRGFPTNRSLLGEARPGSIRGMAMDISAASFEPFSKATSDEGVRPLIPLAGKRAPCWEMLGRRHRSTARTRIAALRPTFIKYFA